MYWNSNSASSSHLETLLNKKDVTLQELMDDEEVLQECRSQNRQLLDYLIRSDVLEELVTLTTVEPEGDDYSKYKYPNIACELLTCDVPQLNERLANDEALMSKLYSFLESDAPLNPLLASFFSKTFSVLIGRSCEQNWYSYQLTCLQVLGFLKSKENCVALLLKHLGTSAIMDLLFKLITEVESEVKENMLNWLDEQNLVQNLVKFFDPSVSSDVHNNAAQLLCDVISTARKKSEETWEQDRILDRIESPEVVSLLLDQILKEPKCETSIIGGISVLLALLEEEKRDANEANCNTYSNLVPAVDNPTPNNKKTSEVVLNTIKAILPRLKDFHDILINPPVKAAVNTTIGLLDPPVGNTRVEVAKLLSVLVANNNYEINKELAELDTINVLLDLFFKYTWNNFLHTQVEHCLSSALKADISVSEGSETPKNFMIAHIFVKCRLLQRILDAWEDNETQQNVHKNPRRGYMGHLIKIANTIDRQAEKGPLVALLTEIVDQDTLSRWKDFTTTKLAAVNETYWTCLGGFHPQDVRQESKLEETFSSYDQLQGLVSYPRQFGSFQEQQFNDVEETVNDWNENSENSSSDEDEPTKRCGPEGQQENSEEFDTLSPWIGEGDKASATMAAVNPWDTSTCSSGTGAINSSSSPDLGWANFESAPFVADFGLNLTPDIKTTIATSVSSEIETIPLDLTPSDSNVNVDEIFSTCEPEMESAQVVENVPQTAMFTDIDAIKQTLSDLNLTNKGSDGEAFPTAEEKFLAPVASESTCAEGEVYEGGLTNSLQNPEAVGDINSSQTKSDKDLIDNFRFHSPQGLMTKCGQQSDFESESSGDGYKLLQENVQSVPNDSNQSSNKSVEFVESSSPPVTSTNGPV